MPKLTLSQLERHLFATADILRGKMNAYIEIVEEHHPEIIAGNPYLQGQSDTPDHT